MLKFVNENINRAYLGNNEVNAIYLGGYKLFGSNSSPIIISISFDYTTETNYGTKQNNESLFLLKKLENELPDLRSELSAYAQRQKILIEMQADYEGFNGTVKRLLKDASANRELKEEIVGVVATLMKVPAHLETAIEIALGSAMQNVVTYNEDGAKSIINYLKQKYHTNSSRQ